MTTTQKPLTQKATRIAWARIDRLSETLTFIRCLYSPEEKIRAADLVVELEGERAYLRGLLDA